MLKLATIASLSLWLSAGAVLAQSATRIRGSVVSIDGP